jgi:aminocarboxymuconate-semialdehyde decarboxylase
VRIVDTHSHVIPPGVVAAMRAGDAPDGIALENLDGTPWAVHRQGYRYPLPPHFHDLTARLAHMDTTGISEAVVSIAPPLFLYWADLAEGVDAARLVNDELARMARDSGGRLSALATLPMRDPDAAVAELRRAVGELGLRGAEIGPHVEGVHLDDFRLRPVLAAAQQLGVPLLVHPYYVGAQPELADFYLTNLLGNPWQTAVCAARLILSGTLDRLPSLDLVLVHGGGHLPYQHGRLDRGYEVRPEAQGCRDLPSSYLRRFHYDSLTHDPRALRFLLELVGADRVVFGTDVPFDMGGGPLAEQLGGYRLDDDVSACVAHRNADRLFTSTGAISHG